MYEKWHELEHQFRAEAKQDAPPFGPGVVEWDYSRYTRALGFSKAPGLDSLQRRACVVASGRHAFRASAARHLKRWGADIGWDFIRVSARPSTLVPDPVIYHLGIAVTHPDSLIFCAAGQQGPPALGKRPRSPAMRIPLSASERWLIAADRVRRRLRTEIATRGLVLFIDDAEYLTPSALTTLSYLLDAQCAWKSHFLSSPANVYVAFSLPARHDEWFHETLARFNPLATPFRIREPVGPRTLQQVAQEPNLTVEEEHVAAVLAEAEVAMPVASLCGLVGAGVVERLVAVPRSALIGLRRVGSKSEAVLVDSVATDTPRLSGDASKSVSDSLASAIRCGHPAGHRRPRDRSPNCDESEGFVGEHSGLGNWPASAMTVPLLSAAKHQQSLDRTSIWGLLDATALHVALAYEESARADLAELTRRPLHASEDVFHLFKLVFWLGLHRVRRLIPDGFWPSLQLPSVPSASADAACVLADMMKGIAQRNAADSASRAQFALELLSGRASNEHPGGPVAIDGGANSDPTIESCVLSPLVLRACLVVGASLPESTGNRATFDEIEQECFSGGHVPAPMLGSLGYALATSAAVGRPHRRWAGQFALIRDLASAAGDLPGLCLVNSAILIQLQRRRLPMLAASLTDELSVLMGTRADPRVQARMGRRVIDFWSLPLPVLAAHCVQRRAGEARGASTELTATDRLELAHNLIHTGEFQAARRTLESLGDSVHRDPDGKLLMAFSRIHLGVLSVDDSEIDQGVAELYEASNHLDAVSRDVVACVCAAARHLVAGQFFRCRATAKAGLNLVARGPVTRSRAAHKFLSWMLMAGSSMSRCFSRSRSPTVPRLVKSLSRLDDSASRLGIAYSRDSERTPLSRIEVAIPAIERLVSTSDRIPSAELLRFAVELRRSARACLDWSDRGLSAAMKRAAPTFFLALRRELSRIVGSALGDDEACVEAGLRIFDTMNEDDLWGQSRSGEHIRRRSVQRMYGVSAVRAARAAQGRWRWGGALWRFVRALPPSAFADRSIVEFRAAGLLGNDEHLEFGKTERFLTDVRANAPLRLVHQPSSPVNLELFAPGADMCGSYGTGGLRTGRRSTRTSRGSWLGTSQQARKVRDSAEKAARALVPTLITGESGTGKELLAKLICSLSTRKNGPVIIVDCGSIVDGLLEAELFGSSAGAYTGSAGERIGLIEAANGGTLVLDRVCDMSARLQTCLLRALESGDYRRLGDDRCRRSDFRLISLALPEIREHVDRGRFRQDLYYRIGGFPIDVPPLSERPGDAVEIANSVAAGLGLSFSAEAQRVIEGHPWPGNVRELINAIHRASLDTCAGQITGSALETAVSSWVGRQDRTPAGMGDCQSGSASGKGRFGDIVLPPASQFGTSEFAAFAGVSRRTAQRQLSHHLKRGAIVRCAAGRATCYQVLHRGSAPTMEEQ